MVKRERERERGLFSLCLMTVITPCLFLTVPWAGLQCVSITLPDHTHLLLYCGFAFRPGFAVKLSVCPF